jgi:type I restriction-modification system DNA methylase subunit
MILSKNEIRRRAALFAKEWENESREEAEAKTFWDEFFNVFGMSRRRVASFEHNVEKRNGKTGFIDVFWKGVMLAEHKSLGRDLDRAFDQAKDYLPNVPDKDLPRYIVVSDFNIIRITDLEEDTEHQFTLGQLSNNTHLFDFISGYNLGTSYEDEEIASIKAAKLMADFHNEISDKGYSGHQLELFLVRVLFCLFAEDTAIFEKGAFRSYVETRTNIDGSDLGIHINQIFEIVNTPLDKRQTNIDEQLGQFPYINGGLFAEHIRTVSFDTTARLKLLKYCSFDWSGISASIFGSLFQGVMDEQQRRELGAHYTSEINILKVIQPLFLDDLYIEFDTVKSDKKRLELFHNKLATQRFFDPACGCGNFLVTAYRELRLLELQVLKKIQSFEKKLQSQKLLGGDELSKINVNQFYGIEIEEFPTLVARVAMYLVDHQMNRLFEKTFGLYQPRIPLRDPAHIYHGDALTKDWKEIIEPAQLSYIFGNPPFYGARLMNKIQKENLQNVFGKLRGVGNLDFVTAWYKKSAEYIQGTQIKVGLVSTNSICQGEQVGILWKHLYEEYGIHIHFAHQTFKWNNDAPGTAAVYCIIVGFANYDTYHKYIYEYETIKSEPVERKVENINAYLVNGPNVFVESSRKRLCISPEMIFGNMANDGGNLIFTPQEKDEFLEKELLAEKYIRELIGAEEFLNNKKRYCLWLVGAEPSELKKMSSVLTRIEKVRQKRLSSTRPATQKLATTPSLFGEIRQPNSNYLMIPRVSSEHRRIIPFGYFTPDIVVSDRCALIPNANLYHLGILNSAMHMSWVNRVCGRLKSDYNYSINIVYNNFPWPENVSESDELKISELSQVVLDARLLYPNSSLADLYDPNTMPVELVKAHQNLDRAVDNLYGKKFQNDEERIAMLFQRYKELVNTKK